jgi:predicted dehydrogenase
VQRTLSRGASGLGIGRSEEFGSWPERVAVIGGGRWARQLTQVLCDLTPPTVRISMHSRHNAESLSVWARSRGLGERVEVSFTWPHLGARSTAVIVANAARDHESAAVAALSECVPVLVEKPMAPTAAASRRLIDLARSRNTRFAAAHVFLFARYLESFARLVTETGGIRSLRVRWMDPSDESRYGEKKRFDPSLPIFADWLPHVLSITNALTPGLPQRCERLKFLRGGAHLELELLLGSTPCSVELVRNGDRRQRIVEVVTLEKTLLLDFSREPGTITCGSQTSNGDPDWSRAMGPAALMLQAFLRWAAGGEFDSRLDIELGLRASEVIDQAAGMYKAALVPWLASELASPQSESDDLRYALTELLQSVSLLPETAIEEHIRRMRQECSKTSDSHWLKALVEAQNPLELIRLITING